MSFPKLPKEIYGVPRKGYGDEPDYVDTYRRLSTAKGQATRCKKEAVIGYIDRWVTVAGDKKLKMESKGLPQIVDDLADWLNSEEGLLLEVDDPSLYEEAFQLVDKLHSRT